jgi:hypothetical protein
MTSTPTTHAREQAGPNARRGEGDSATEDARKRANFTASRTGAPHAKAPDTLQTDQGRRQIAALARPRRDRAKP